MGAPHSYAYAPRQDQEEALGEQGGSRYTLLTRARLRRARVCMQHEQMRVRSWRVKGLLLLCACTAPESSGSQTISRDGFLVVEPGDRGHPRNS